MFKSIIKDSKRPSRLVENIDLDVTPVMNMFIILIPFLVSMAVFAHLAILPFTLPPAAGQGSGPKPEDLKLTVTMTARGITLSMGENVLDSIPVAGQGYDYEALTAALVRQRPGLGHQDEVVIAVDDGIIFDKVVRCMDHCRDAGFTKIGLASGTSQDTLADNGPPE